MRSLHTLIIHPSDKSTDFLSPIYEALENKTVITGGISKLELLRLAHSHQRVMMMGHGSPSGLFSMGQFENEEYLSYIIDLDFVYALHQKDNVYIWCNANQFVEQHQLRGFYSGMFISELMEAALYKLDVSQETINHSNQLFSEIASKHIHLSSESIYYNVTNEYRAFADSNPIIGFNRERLYSAS